MRDTVAAPIEQQVNGVENMLYMSSQCTNDGTYTLTVTFKLGTDLNMAQVLVQNRVALAMPVIPDVVQRQGINVKKKSPSMMMIVNLISPNDGRYDSDIFLPNYATIQIKDELLRLPGVGDVTYLGQRDYSMRAWLDPGQTGRAEHDAPTTWSHAINEQNIQVAAGQIGQQPVPTGQQFQLTINTLGRLIDARAVRRHHSQSRPRRPTHDRPATSATIVRLRRRRPGRTGRPAIRPVVHARRRAVGGAVDLPACPAPTPSKPPTASMTRWRNCKRDFPQGLDYKIVYDTTPFIRESIVEVLKTLRDAIMLVAIVVLVFLQNWRAALIPLIAVPVAIIGTFAVMAGMGFTLNNLSLFGLVLAIGIVVDDAIVVVENVERWLAKGCAPREAATQGHGRSDRPGHRHRVGAVRRVRALRVHRAASPGNSSASSPSPSPSRR